MSGLLEQTEWEGRIYSGGFIKSSGGRLEVSDKATDEVLSVVGAASPADVRRSPLLGEHTDEILRKVLGYSEKEVGDIKQSGAITAPDKPAKAEAA